MEGEGTWRCRRGCSGWFGSTSSTCMWDIKVLVSWKLEGQTKTLVDASRLLGSRIILLSYRRDVPHYRGGGHIFHYWIVPTGRGGEPTLLQEWRWPHHWWVHCSILFFKHEKGWESNPDKLHPGTRLEVHTIGTRKDNWASFTPPGLTTIDVLCGSMYETHSVGLEHCAIE